MYSMKYESDKRADIKYKSRLRQVNFRLFPTDADIDKKLEERNSAGEPTATYIKRIIREDIKKSGN